LNPLGRALYCAGRFEEAAKHLTQAEAAFKETTYPTSSIIYTRLFQAMTHQCLGHADQAKEWLEKAIKDIEQPPQDRPQDGAAMAWNRRLTLQILRREAEELLKEESATGHQQSEKKPIDR
jgi:tetratricopeptide (TPR) repeat protein